MGVTKLKLFDKICVKNSWPETPVMEDECRVSWVPVRLELSFSLFRVYCCVFFSWNSCNSCKEVEGGKPIGDAFFLQEKISD